MFDIGFSEFLVIGLVALLVLGPERLPRVARTAGLLLGRLQRYVNDVKADIQREMHVAELKRLGQQIEADVRSAESSVQLGLAEVERSILPADLPPNQTVTPGGSATEPSTRDDAAGKG
ncbi:MAG: hypothetical protein AMXMBFR6_04660 [Betaproteobacteria bacterium]|nr:twin-arginine translocase subunit TatB [Rhodocyclaceae bacterium]